ncbi:hypothetical protein CMU66_15220 [Elizabethkingia anophelis]|uniref:antiviral reverse transcriptase Drt3a n=1 Tax=Elizabethkingia anophelis TaxID=1117645 RepID=UPI00293C6917|nr:hypothetical protein [Elizabethkingia anophelis]MDV3561870.1 hypothetical protein [Elizabethkingia anophelis]MDV3625882.1 hypothetical protein [Elizabethkingia anophelis]MDV3642048.1 hypothetical protein [Elizabethkingia anophelis]MDV3658174.1 hypothetical protein [Elizabethkingia anophelis]
MKQTYNSQELIRYLKKGELYRNDLEKEEIIDEVDFYEQQIINETFEFDIISSKDYYFIENIPQKLILRKLNDNIKRIYKDEQANRKFIIQQIKTLLNEDAPFWVIKADIKSFYESIDRDRIFKKLKNDAMLSYYSISLLKKIFDNPIISSGTGLPRGMNISSTLSEIYMRKFDNWVQRSKDVYYYARFVDDIIIFLCNKDSAIKLFDSLNETLGEICSLEINTTKTELKEGETFKIVKTHRRQNVRFNKIEYLGYQFYIDTSSKKVKKVNISIADKKVKKIKTRLVKSYVDFSINKDPALLIKRIKFLTGNYAISKSSDDSMLKAGIYYNYTHLNNHKVLEDLNHFHRKILFSKTGSLGGKLNLAINAPLKNSLKRYCFKAGHTKKTFNSFSFAEMSEIIKCW